MSTKASIFLTKDNEHWYEECNQARYVKGEHKGDDIYLEFDSKNVFEFEKNDDGILIGLRGDSDLARHLTLFRKMEWEIISLKRALKELNDNQHHNGAYYGSDLNEKIDRLLKK